MCSICASFLHHFLDHITRQLCMLIGTAFYTCIDSKQFWSILQNILICVWCDLEYGCLVGMRQGDVYIIVHERLIRHCNGSNVVFNKEFCVQQVAICYGKIFNEEQSEQSGEAKNLQAGANCMGTFSHSSWSVDGVNLQGKRKKGNCIFNGRCDGVSFLTYKSNLVVLNCLIKIVRCFHMSCHRGNNATKFVVNFQIFF